jgi:hypothetical protein
MEIFFVNPKDEMYVVGCYASIKTFAAVAFRVYVDNDKYDIKDHYLKTGSISINKCAKELMTLAKKYRVTHFLSNDTAEVIYTGGTLNKDYDFNDYHYETQWEVTEINNFEKMMLLTESYALEKKITISKEIAEKWQQELNTFNLKACEEKEKIYPLLFAFWHGIKGVQANTNWLLCSEAEYEFEKHIQKEGYPTLGRLDKPYRF